MLVKAWDIYPSLANGRLRNFRIQDLLSVEARPVPEPTRIYLASEALSDRSTAKWLVTPFAEAGIAQSLEAYRALTAANPKVARLLDISGNEAQPMILLTQEIAETIPGAQTRPFDPQPRPARPASARPTTAPPAGPLPPAPLPGGRNHP